MNDLSLYYLSHHQLHTHSLSVLHHRSQVAVNPKAVVELTILMRVATEAMLFSESEAAIVVAAIGVRDGSLSFHHIVLEHSPVLELVYHQQVTLSFCHVVMKGPFVYLPAIFRRSLPVNKLVVDEISSVVHSL